MPFVFKILYSYCWIRGHGNPVYRFQLRSSRESVQSCNLDSRLSSTVSRVRFVDFHKFRNKNLATGNLPAKLHSESSSPSFQVHTHGKPQTDTSLPLALLFRCLGSCIFHTILCSLLRLAFLNTVLERRSKLVFHSNAAIKEPQGFDRPRESLLFDFRHRGRSFPSQRAAETNPPRC